MTTEEDILAVRMETAILEREAAERRLHAAKIEEHMAREPIPYGTVDWPWGFPIPEAPKRARSLRQPRVKIECQCAERVDALEKRLTEAGGALNPIPWPEPDEAGISARADTKTVSFPSDGCLVLPESG